MPGLVEHVRFIDVSLQVQGLYYVESFGGCEIVGHPERTIQLRNSVEPGVVKEIFVPEMLMCVDNLHESGNRGQTLTATAVNCQSIAMKNFFHVGPPFALGACFQGILHRHHNRPPFLGLRISGHFCHVRRVVRAVILEIAEQQVVFQVDGIISDIALVDHSEDFGPNRRMVFLIGLKRFRPDSDHRTVTPHVIVLSRSACALQDAFGSSTTGTPCVLRRRPTIFDDFESWLQFVKLRRFAWRTGNMTPVRIRSLETRDVRFPLDQGAGSDAVHSGAEYAFATTLLATDDKVFGTGIVLTLGLGNQLVCEVIEWLGSELIGREIEDLMANFGTVAQKLAQHSQLRWLGPHKGVVHLALASLTNACFDLWAKSRGVPLWRLLLDLG